MKNIKQNAYNIIISLTLLTFLLTIFGCDNGQKNDTPNNEAQDIYELKYKKILNIESEGETTNKNCENIQFAIYKKGEALSEEYASMLGIKKIQWDFNLNNNENKIENESNNEKQLILNPEVCFPQGSYNVSASLLIEDIDYTKKPILKTVSTSVTSIYSDDIINGTFTARRIDKNELRKFEFVSNAESKTGEILTYVWDFGDGTIYTNPSKENYVVHTFEKFNERYNVKLKVENGLDRDNSSILDEMVLQTDKPWMKISCLPDGPEYKISEQRELLGQRLKCSTELLGGQVDDIKYSWYFYNEVMLNKAECISKKNHIFKEVEIDKGSKQEKCFSLYTEGSSAGKEDIVNIFATGGHKYVRVIGRSLKYIGIIDDNKNDNSLNEISGEYYTYLPSNVKFGKLGCKQKTAGIGSTSNALDYVCEAVAQAYYTNTNLPHIQNSEVAAIPQYVIPLKEYSGIVYKKREAGIQEGIAEIADEILDKELILASAFDIKCKTANSDFSSIDEASLLNENNLIAKQYTECKFEMNYTSKKYDIEDIYSNSYVTLKYFDSFKKDIFTSYDIETDFKVKGPKIKDITVVKEGVNQYKFSVVTNQVLAGVKYIWDFGDGKTITSDRDSYIYEYSSYKPINNVSVYIESDTFGKTDTFSKTISFTSKIDNNCSFRVTSFNKKDNSYTFTINSCGISVINEDDRQPLKGKSTTENEKYINVETKYRLILSGGEYEFTYEVPKSAIKGNVVMFNSVKATRQNIKNKELSIPYGHSLDAKLVIYSDQIDKNITYEKYSIIEMEEIKVSKLHFPCKPKYDNTMYFYYIGTSASEEDRLDLNDMICEYDINPLNIIVDESYPRYDRVLKEIKLYTLDSNTSGGTHKIQTSCGELNRAIIKNEYIELNNSTGNQPNPRKYLQANIKVIDSPLNKSIKFERVIQFYVDTKSEQSSFNATRKWNENNFETECK